MSKVNQIHFELKDSVEFLYEMLRNDITEKLTIKEKNDVGRFKIQRKIME